MGGCHAAINPPTSCLQHSGTKWRISCGTVPPVECLSPTTNKQRHHYVGHPQNALLFAGRAFVDDIHVTDFISTRLIMKCVYGRSVVCSLLDYSKRFT